MSGHTGLLTLRCDPYGAESRILLAGGTEPDSRVGRIMWHCPNRADARYRMVCTGGDYGTRESAGAGLLPGYTCPGGHRGQVMPLCTDHRRSLAARQAGLCPACAWPPAARALKEAIEARQADMYGAARLGLYVAAAKLAGALEDLQAQMTELHATGTVHRCPLRLEEVS